MAMPIDYSPLAPDLRISRLLTGLWQVADMERDGRSLDLDDAARVIGQKEKDCLKNHETKRQEFSLNRLEEIPTIC